VDERCAPAINDAGPGLFAFIPSPNICVLCVDSILAFAAPSAPLFGHAPIVDRIDTFDSAGLSLDTLEAR
jgi:hypothetical protein